MSSEEGEGSSSTLTICDQFTTSLEKKIEDDKAPSYSSKALPSIPFIKRVPNRFRLENDKAYYYTPSVVSIGPLHREDENLQPMEHEKRIYVSSLFNRIGNAKERCVKRVAADMLEVQDKLRKCYPDHVEPGLLTHLAVGFESTLNSFLSDQVRPNESLLGNFLHAMRQHSEKVVTNLVEMMVLDGCFIIELIYRHYKRETDPILDDSSKCSNVKRDLLLLENQIPFFALKQLFSLTVQQIPTAEVGGNVEQSSCPIHTPTLIECLRGFFGDIMGINDTAGDPLHILHLLHKLEPVSSSGDQDQPEYRDQDQPGYRPTATQLKNAGVQLRKPCGETSNMFDLKFRIPCFLLFWKSGFLEIPSFSVNNMTVPVLKNVVAFECCCPGVKQSSLTSHALLMDILIESVQDVKLLEDAEIIRNGLDSELVSQIFNGMFKNVETHHFQYNKLLNTMKDFCTPRRAQMETVRRNCAGNLWIRLSVFAATIIFLLTLLQTVYTMLSYHRPNKA